MNYFAPAIEKNEHNLKSATFYRNKLYLEIHIDFLDYIALLLNGIKSIQNEAVP